MMPPHTYAEWSELLDRLGAGEDDNDTLSAMQQGTIAWQDGVAERFTSRLCTTVNGRMNAALDRFQKTLAHAGGWDGSIVQSLLSLRKEFSFLARVMDISAIPEDDRKQYVNLVVVQANKAQASLEDSAKRDRSGKLASLVRNHKINDIKKMPYETERKNR